MKKIDIEKSVVRKFSSRYDLSNGMLDLGQQGYFSDTEDFAEYKYGTLVEVMGNVNARTYPFVKDGNISDSCFKYFIPANLVVFKEEPKEPKKYRPYTDMCGLPFKVGDVITIRAKDSYDIIEALVTEISYKENLISIGSREWCDTQFLLDTFEILINDEWKPLGVEENEED